MYKSDTTVPAKFAFVATPKNKLNAVQRNRAKRILRELVRLNKNEMYSFLKNNNTSIHVVLIYQNTTLLDAKSIETAFHRLIEKLIIKIQSAK